MAEYDGEIRLKTVIDSSSIEQDLMKKKDDYKELSRERERLIKKQIQLQKEYANSLNQQSSLALQLESQENRILKILNKREAVQDAIASSSREATDRQIEKLHQYEMDLDLAQKKETLLKSKLEEKSTALKKVSEDIRDNSNKLKSNSINLDKVKNNTQKYIEYLNSIKSGISKPIETAGKSIVRFGNKIFSLAKSAFVFNILSEGFRELSNASRALISSDEILAKSLSEIKSNLLTAFAPIYEAVLPALRELGKFLSWVSLQLATFMSFLFGKTLDQTQQSAYNMNKTINSSTKALKNQSKALKDVSKSANSALASFDRIEVLNLNKGLKKSGKQKENQIPIGINKDSFKKVNSEISSFWSSIAERLKAPFKNLDVSRLNDSLQNLKNTLSQFGQPLGEGLWWIYENVLAPFASWTISETLPRFLNVFSASLKVIQPIAGQVGEDLKFIYEFFLKPIAEWSGSKINEFLDKLKDSLESLANWLSDEENKTVLEWLSSFLIGLGAGTVIFGLNSLYKIITAKLIPSILQLTVAFLSNPWNWVVLGIAAVIASIIMIAKHWDEMEKYFNDAWENAKRVIDGVTQLFKGSASQIKGWVDFLAGLFTGDWTRMWKGAINIVIGTLNQMFGIFNTITSAVKAVWNYILGGINFIIDGINNAGFKMPDWLGGAEFRLNIPKVRVPQGFLRLPEIPALAQGAVLDGSDPFLAWINDQPKGQTNIETPLNTMIDAFNTAFKSNSNTNNVVIQASGDISQLISYLHFELKKEDAIIGNNMITGDVYV